MAGFFTGEFGVGLGYQAHCNNIIGEPDKIIKALTQIQVPELHAIYINNSKGPAIASFCDQCVTGIMIAVQYASFVHGERESSEGANNLLALCIANSICWGI